MFSSRSVTAVIAASMMMMSAASARQLQANASIIESACSTPDLSTLCAAVNASASAFDFLSGDGPFTVFAPDNGAFDALDPALLAALLTPAYSAHLFSVLAYHVVNNASIASSALPADATAANVTLAMAGGGMAGGSGETTIGFVDTAAAFITNVTNTSGMYINFTTVDIAATNGIVHVIDGVLLPQWAITPLSALIPMLATGDYSTIASLIPIAFPDGIPSVGGLTVLAPTDEAFAALDSAVLEALKNDTAALQTLLTHHVISGIVPAELLLAGGITNVTMLSTMNLPVMVTDGTVMIGNATVVLPDILANNGIIHGIDTVIMGAAAPTAPIVPTMLMPSAPTMTMPSAPASAPTMTMPSAPIKADVDGAAPVSAPNRPDVIPSAPTSSAFSMIVTSMKMMIGSLLFVVVGVSL